ncbi:DUF1360 domain-containing protein [Kribbella sp. CA-294648]|uniref:DUF1360 domain-containing protein n=1 Tax=Kribbella sp. CA-294648 TaxID=3239948 RepID=UPI003D8ACE30
MTDRAWAQRLTEAADRQSAQYGADHPLRGHVGALAAFALYGATLVAVGKLSGRRLPDHIQTFDLVLGATATFRFSKLVTRNTVTDPLRAPFTRYGGPGGPAETIDEPRGSGVRRTIGELMTCPFCFSVWTATTYTAGMVLAPRATRLIGAGLTMLTGADLLQLGSTTLTRVATAEHD